MPTATSTKRSSPAPSRVKRGDDVSPDDVCLVMYSSGTTGRPKGVMLTQANMVAHTMNAHDGWEFEPGDKCMVSMPLFHVGGSSYVLFGIHDGVPSVMTRDPDGASLAGAIITAPTAPSWCRPCWRRCCRPARRGQAVRAR